MSSMESLDKLQAELSGNVYADAFHTLYKLSQDVSVEHSELMAQAMKWVHKEKVEPLEAENAKLTKLARWMYQVMDESCAVHYPYEPAPVSMQALIRAEKELQALGTEVPE